MRTSLWIALALLAATLLSGWVTSREVLRISDRYVSAAEELSSMTEHREWQRAAETAEAYLNTWQETVPALQMLINHEDTDSVTLSLVQLKAAIRAEDVTACFVACAELRENAQHLYHRDAFTAANVL